MPRLIYNKGMFTEQIFNIGYEATTIGRAEENHVVLSNKSLSRRHAQLERINGQMLLIDLSSKNGTFLNGQKIDRTLVQDGDLIKCGDIIFHYQERDAFDEPDLGFTILKEIPSEYRQTSLADLLVSEKRDKSALKVKESAGLQRDRDKLRILLDVSKILSSPEEIHTVLNNIVELLFQIMDVDRAAVLMYDEGSGKLLPKITKSSPEFRKETNFYSQHIVNYVIEKNVAVLIGDAKNDPRFDEAKSIIFQSVRSSMCVPLKAKEQVWGVLYVDNLVIPNHYSDEDLEFLSAFASQAAIAIENSMLMRQIQEEAVVKTNLLRFFPPSTYKKIITSQNITLGAREMEVTALFSDISQFTTMSSSMDPMAVVDMLNNYFPVMAEIVFKYEGTLEKYIGDALMAVWGAPFSHEDDVVRAIFAAMEMQQALTQLNKKWELMGKDLHIDIHIGLNTGPVAAGNIGSEKYIQYATIGDAVNVASRICSAAASGEVLASETTLRQTLQKLGGLPGIEVDKLAPLKVKGKNDSLQLYRIHWQTWDKTIYVNRMKIA
jgi:adenylate cyclase